MPQAAKKKQEEEEEEEAAKKKQEAAKKEEQEVRRSREPCGSLPGRVSDSTVGSALPAVGVGAVVARPDRRHSHVSVAPCGPFAWHGSWRSTHSRCICCILTPAC